MAERGSGENQVGGGGWCVTREYKFMTLVWVLWSRFIYYSENGYYISLLHVYTVPIWFCIRDQNEITDHIHKKV